MALKSFHEMFRVLPEGFQRFSGEFREFQRRFRGIRKSSEEFIRVSIGF